jgi:hypothetical protein
MAIGYIQTSGGVNTTVGTTNSQSTSITGGGNVIGLVFIETSTIGIDPTGVTWGGVAMTKINTFGTGTSRLTQVSLWGVLLGNTSTASRTITATWASSYSTNLWWGTYSGVSQTDAVGTLQNSTNGTLGLTVDPNEITTAITPSVSNSWLVAFGLDLGASFTPNGGTTQRFWSNFWHIDSNGVVSGSSTLGGSISPAALFANNAVVLIPSTASATNSNFFNIMQ